MTSPSQAVTTDDGRYYPRNGERYVSVTTVLSALPKPYLTQWAAREVAKYCLPLIAGTHYVDADGTMRPVSEESEPLVGDDFLRHLKSEPIRQRDTAGSLGDKVHDHAEVMLRCKMDAEESLTYASQIEDVKERRRVESFAKFMREHDVQPLHIEATVYSDAHLYAGSCDLMAVIDGVPTICDFKTSKSIHAEVALQLAAYANADYILHDSGDKLPLPAFQRAAVLHIRDRGYTYREVASGAEVFDAFLAILAVKRLWLDGASKTALGDKLNPKYQEEA